MDYTPNMATLASGIADPVRAGMLAQLIGGKALTASELAGAGGVSKQTASTHLGKLVELGLVTFRRQGRHKYFALADDDVAALLEQLMAVAEKKHAAPVRAGPRDAGLREARICYDHLAGDMGVALFDSLVSRSLLRETDYNLVLTDDGRAFFADFGIDMAALEQQRRPMCRACLDWSVRRSHLAGGLGAALLTAIEERGWARRDAGSRRIRFSPDGRRAFSQAFPLNRTGA